MGLNENNRQMGLSENNITRKDFLYHTDINQNSFCIDELFRIDYVSLEASYRILKRVDIEAERPALAE